MGYTRSPLGLARESRLIRFGIDRKSDDDDGLLRHSRTGLAVNLPFAGLHLHRERPARAVLRDARRYLQRRCRRLVHHVSMAALAVRVSTQPIVESKASPRRELASARPA